MGNPAPRSCRLPRLLETFTGRIRIKEEHVMRITLAALAAVTLAFSAGAAEKERKISLDKLPPEIKSAADRAIPGAKWHSAEQETEKGGIRYELKGKGPDNDRHVEVEIAPDGKLIQTEVEVPFKEVPEVVRNKPKSGWPDFEPEEVKAITREGKASGYEFEGPRRQGKELEVFISGNGDIVEVEEDD
jgi:hypothetical protein